jgi:DNA-binding NtrC family response regulator
MPEEFGIAKLPILLVDDEPALLRAVGIELRGAGFERVAALDDSRKVLPLLEERAIGAVVLDLTMPHLSGQELLKRIREVHPEIPVIVMTGKSEVQTAVQCMRDGAIDYLVKPVDHDRLAASVSHALQIRRYQTEMHSLRELALTESATRHDAFSGFATQSKEVLRIFRYLEQVATLEHPVLICGETGTGKELIARAVHRISGRTGPFVPVDLAGCDDDRFSEALFGEATQEVKGSVARAGDGTVFLDEIGNLGGGSQVRLLRLLQDGTFLQLGGDRPLRSRARFIVATSRDLDRDARAGRFRRDLYHKLDAYRVQVPPLRARPADLPLLVTRFVEKAAVESGKTAPRIPRELFVLLGTYSFPGNVRELESMCRDAVARHKGGILALRSFKDRIAQNPSAAQPAAESSINASIASAFEQLQQLPSHKEVGRALEEEAMRRANNNQGIAADLIGMTRAALNRHLVKRRGSGPEPQPRHSSSKAP